MKQEKKCIIRERKPPALYPKGQVIFDTCLNQVKKNYLINMVGCLAAEFRAARQQLPTRPKRLLIIILPTYTSTATYVND